MYQGRSGHVIGCAARAWNNPLYNDFWYLDARVGAPDPDVFPLPHGWYYGPRSGPTESVSGEVGEPAYQIDGLKRLQRALKVPETGRWVDIRDRVVTIQYGRPELGPPNGHVGPLTWAVIINEPTGGSEMDERIYDIREQITGSRTLGQYPGWPQLGDRTLVDAVAAIGVKLGIDGFKTPPCGGAS